MKINLIRIHNVLGIKNLEIKPGAITEIKGRNNSGKTSTLEAIRAVISGGRDATLLRKGEKKGEIVLILDDGTEVERTITETDSTLTVTHPELGKISRPQTYLDKLTDALSVNPVRFLTAPEKQRTEYLLESLPLSVTSEQIKEATGFSVPIDESEHAFDVLESLRSQLYEDRTGVNRAAKEKRATISQLAESIPEDWDPEHDYDSELNLVEKKKDELERELEYRLNQTQEEFYKHKKLAESTLSKTIDRLRETMESQIRKAREDFENCRAAATKKASEEIESHIRTRDQLVRDDRAKYDPQIESLTSEKVRLHEKNLYAAKVSNTIDIQKRQKSEFTKLEERSEKLTKALTGLEALKKQLISNLPIPGLEIRGGAIYKDDIPYDRLPESVKVWIAVELAKLRAGKLGLVSVDGLERLDKETFKEFEKLALESGLQFIVAKVTDEPFTVETKNQIEKEKVNV